jgi:hypothetical protein
MSVSDRIEPNVELPIACTLDGTAATDRAGELERLCADALVGRERTQAGARLRFRDADGVERRVRDLVAKEEACCAFMTSTVTVVGGEVLWDVSVPEDARPLLDDWYGLVGGAAERAVVATPVALTTKSTNPPSSRASQASPSSRRSFAPAGAIVGGLLCALICAVPAIGASLVAGASARWLHIPVWAIVITAGALLAFGVRRHLRRGSEDNCGC